MAHHRLAPEWKAELASIDAGISRLDGDGRTRHAQAQPTKNAENDVARAVRSVGMPTLSCANSDGASESTDRDALR